MPPLNLDYWDLHPHMGFAGVVMLEDDTKMQLEVLFGMIDRDHSGVITHDDFVFVTNMEQVHGLHGLHDGRRRRRPAGRGAGSGRRGRGG